MLVYSSGKFVGKRNGHGYEYYTRDAICGECGKIIGSQDCYELSPKEQKYFFRDRDKKHYVFCPYCGKPLNKKEEK